MKKSESIKNLAGALAKAQAEMPVVKMNAQNPFLKNKYADLGAVILTSRPVLSRHELSVTQFPASDGDKIGLSTLLTHSSGEWIEETVFLSLGEQKGLTSAQLAGSVISYLRRYSLASVLGLYADEDTDGHGSNGASPDIQLEKKPSPEKKTPVPATDIQKLRVDFGKKYAEADALRIKGIPTINGKSTEQDIKFAMNEIDEKIKEVKNVLQN